VEYRWNILKDLTKKDKLEIRQRNNLSTQMNYLKNGTRMDYKNNQKQARNLHRIWIFSHYQSKNVKFSLYFSDLSFFHFSTFFNDFCFLYFVYVLSKRGKNRIWIWISQLFVINQIQKVISNSSDGSDSSVLLLPLSFDLFFWLFLALACTLFVLFLFLFFIALTAASFHHKLESQPHYAWSFAF